MEPEFKGRGKQRAANSAELFAGLFQWQRDSLTQWHDGEIFPSKLAGQCDFLPEAPAFLRDGVVSGGRRVVAHLTGSRGRQRRETGFSGANGSDVDDGKRTCSHSER